MTTSAAYESFLWFDLESTVHCWFRLNNIIFHLERRLIFVKGVVLHNVNIEEVSGSGLRFMNFDLLICLNLGTLLSVKDLPINLNALDASVLDNEVLENLLGFAYHSWHWQRSWNSIVV